jgi:putative Mg2+ transporter-C (MgtC) family protein
MILDANLTLADILLKVILPLSLTFFIAAFVGLERQNVGKAAGLSSHILVAMASAGIAVMQRLMFEQQIDLGFGDPEGQRVIAQVITGVGFVGAGVIIKDQANVVKGITTAATIWFTAMIGLIIGSGYCRRYHFRIIYCIICLIKRYSKRI